VIARQVQVEGGAFGILKSLNDAFVNPLLISRGAGPIALGIYKSGANLFGFGAGWLGPTLASKTGNVQRTILTGLTFGRTVFFLLALIIWFREDANAAWLIPLFFAWGIGEGLVLPLWASVIAGMVGPGERGRWLAMRATAATLSTLPVMAAVIVIFLVATREDALPIAYAVAALAGLVSLIFVSKLLNGVGETPAPAALSL
jgi:MFS family permease